MKKKYIALFLTLVVLFCACDGLQIEQPPASSTAQTLDGLLSSQETTSSQIAETTVSTQTTAPSTPSVPPEDCAHADADENGSCDICSISVIVNLDFYSINDLHGKVVNGESQPGIEELTSYFYHAYEQDDHAILLSAGDMWQGSSESNLTKGALLTDWMNEMGIVSMTLGNHEFDWGEAYIEMNAEIAEFPFLAINIFDRDTNERVPYCAPSVMIERDGVQIGIIGAIGDCYSSISGEHSQDFYFKVGKELTALVKDESERLRQEGADFIIYSIHDGYGQSKNNVTTVAGTQLSSYYDTSLSRGYVDLVFEGHTHQRYVLRDEYGVYHLQGGGENRGISHADVNINTVTSQATVLQAEFVENDVYSAFAADGLINELLLKYEEQIAPSRKELGMNAAFRNSTYLRKLVAKLYYQAGMEKWGEDYDIVLGGGFISVRNPYELEKGTVTYAMLQSIFPFDNRLVLCSIKGRDLKNKFFETSNSNYFIYYEQYGEDVWANLDPDATYYVIVDTYSSSYTSNRLTVVAEYDDNIYARDLLAAFIENGGLANG